MWPLLKQRSPDGSQIRGFSTSTVYASPQHDAFGTKDDVRGFTVFSHAACGASLMDPLSPSRWEVALFPSSPPSLKDSCHLCAWTFGLAGPCAAWFTRRELVGGFSRIIYIQNSAECWSVREMKRCCRICRWRSTSSSTDLRSNPTQSAGATAGRCSPCTRFCSLPRPRPHPMIPEEHWDQF